MSYKKIAIALAAALLISPALRVSAATVEERIAVQRSLPIESNQIPDWPEGPVVTAESAILIEADTGAVLYAKNIHKAQYPASTTKILTTLIAAEQCSLDEKVNFSYEAVHGIPVGSNHIAMNEGDTLTMEQCLQAILIRSANEVSYAVAEHIGGTWEGFAKMMNDRAKELGAVDSNFVNPNGLPDENHYTSAYDLAMIGRAFFANDMLCQITQMPSLRLMKDTGEYVDQNKMELLPGKKYAYEYTVGCKTGYTDAARSTLVSCAEKNGMKLICVVLKDENPGHYEDSIALFNYGFSNFEKINVSETETKYNIGTNGFFYSGNSLFGSSSPILGLNKQDCIVLPKDVDFSQATSTISYDTPKENQAAVITYTYKDVYVGQATLDFISSTNKNQTYEFDNTGASKEQENPSATEVPSNQEGTNNESTTPGSEEPTASSTENEDLNSEGQNSEGQISEGQNSEDDNFEDDEAPMFTAAPSEEKQEEPSYVFVDIIKIILTAIGVIAGIVVILFIIYVVKNSNLFGAKKKRRRSSYPKEISVRSIRKKNIREAKKRIRRRKRGW